MKKILFFIVFSVLISVSCTTDRPEEAHFRIASTSLMTDEILIELLNPSQIAALSKLAADEQYSLIADRVKPMALPAIAITEIEQIVALKPTVILAANWSDAAAVQNLKDFGIKVLLVESPRNFEEVYKLIELIGQVSYQEEKANDLIRRYKIKELALANAVSEQQNTPSVIDYSGFGTSGGNATSWGEIVNKAGLANVVDQLSGADQYGFIPLSLETLLDLDPDYIYLSNGLSREQFMQENPVVSGLRAVQDSHLLSLSAYDNKLISATSHYMIDGAWALHHAVFGEQKE